MIKDNIKNANIYIDLSERLKLGLKYLGETDFSTLENGKYEILGSEVYAMVQQYMPKEESEGKFEAHKKYIDIQYVIKGEEKIGVGDIKDFSESTEYNNEKDIVFLSSKDDSVPEFIDLKAGEFAIFNPQDAHMPSIATGHLVNVRKVVVKVLV